MRVSSAGGTSAHAHDYRLAVGLDRRKAGAGVGDMAGCSAQVVMGCLAVDIGG